MSDLAKLEIDGKVYEFPVLRGSENEIAIDIKTLRGVTKGVITLDSGFKNTGSCESKITFLNGEEGILRHRGYAIEDLTKKACFLEVAYLIIFGELPTKAEFSQFEKDIGVRNGKVLTPEEQAVEDVITMKKETKTKEQVDMLLDLGLTKKEIKALGKEDLRVRKIIELQKKDKKRQDVKSSR